MSKIKNPMLFQGKLRSKKYFEGWYYKNVSIKDNVSLAVIPGVSLSDRDPHAFVQVIMTPPMETIYYRYGIDEFTFEDNPFRVKIGNNIFERDKVVLNLKNDEKKISGELNYTDLSPIETSLFTPNIMGIFAYIPSMECNHGVISMNHIIKGRIDYGGQYIDFENGKGYIEKDWGRSFPREYIWMQANHFEDRNSGFMMSIAKIPMLGRTFDGHILNIQYKGEEYRFATYNSSKVTRLDVSENRVEVELEKGKYRLLVVACIEEFGDLKAPKLGEMSDIIKEGLSGSIYLKMTEEDRVLINMKSDFAGIEISGY